MTRAPPPAAPPPLAAAVRLAGGLRPVAAAAGVDPSNLSRFLRGGGGVSEEGVARVEAVLLGAGSPWVRLLRPRRADAELVAALQWHFPRGARMARVAWGAAARARVARHVRGAEPPGVYAAADGEARAVVLFAAGPALPRALFPEAFPDLRWWADDPERAVLGFADPALWARGEVPAPEFDAAWPGAGYDPTADDVLRAIRGLGIGYADAIRRLHRA